jgi:hypothetical protein
MPKLGPEGLPERVIAPHESMVAAVGFALPFVRERHLVDLVQEPVVRRGRRFGRANAVFLPQLRYKSHIAARVLRIERGQKPVGSRDPDAQKERESLPLGKIHCSAIGRAEWVAVIQARDEA